MATAVAVLSFIISSISNWTERSRRHQKKRRNLQTTNMSSPAGTLLTTYNANFIPPRFMPRSELFILNFEYVLPHFLIVHFATGFLLVQYVFMTVFSAIVVSLFWARFTKNPKCYLGAT